MKLYIKYMVSLRCKMIVKDVLKNLGLKYAAVEPGMVEMHEDITPAQRKLLRERLRRFGMELLNNKKSLLVDKIKNVIIELVCHTDELPAINYSNYISEKMGYDYTYLANMFSEIRGITIQQYIILHKTERAKELLIYDEMTLTEIAFKLNYSSVAHLSNQFKKVTGLTPSFFKQLKNKRRIGLKDA